MVLHTICQLCGTIFIIYNREIIFKFTVSMYYIYSKEIVFKFTVSIIHTLGLGFCLE